MKICGIDIGKENFAFFVDEVTDQQIAEMKGKPLDHIFITGKRFAMKVTSVGEETSSGWSSVERRNLIKFLDTCETTFESCDVICVEQQYFRTFRNNAPSSRKNPGTECNTSAIKIAECVMTWFEMQMPHKLTMFIPSNMKYLVTGAPKRMDKPARKKWSIDKFEEVFNARDDDVKKLFELKNATKKAQLAKWPDAKRTQLITKIGFDTNDADVYSLAQSHFDHRQKMDDIGDAFLLGKAYLIAHVLK